MSLGSFLPDSLVEISTDESSEEDEDTGEIKDK